MNTNSSNFIVDSGIRKFRRRTLIGTHMKFRLRSSLKRPLKATSPENKSNDSKISYKNNLYFFIHSGRTRIIPKEIERSWFQPPNQISKGFGTNSVHAQRQLRNENTGHHSQVRHPNLESQIWSPWKVQEQRASRTQNDLWKPNQISLPKISQRASNQIWLWKKPIWSRHETFKRRPWEQKQRKRRTEQTNSRTEPKT